MMNAFDGSMQLITVKFHNDSLDRKTMSLERSIFIFSLVKSASRMRDSDVSFVAV